MDMYGANLCIYKHMLYDYISVYYITMIDIIYSIQNLMCVQLVNMAP